MLGIHQMSAGAQFFLHPPSYLRRPLTLDAARLSLTERIRRRDEGFLEKIRLDIYDQPSSPYLQLLQHAGCEFEEIESGVRLDGLEATLLRLFLAGVYLTVDEFKGPRRLVAARSLWRVTGICRR